MEFTIDFKTVRKIVAQEGVQARAELAELGPLRAYQASLQRQDDRLAQAPDAPTLACKAGCSWCCHFSVDVRPVEVLNILEFIERTFTTQQRQRLHSEIEANSSALKQLDEIERMQRNIKCPFLQEGRCGIYSARPQTCRNYHATDAAGCQKSFEEPDNLDIAPEFAPLVYQTGAAHVDAFSKVMRDAGYDIDAFELSTALLEAMADPALIRRRFEGKQKVFAALRGTDVPLEFIDLE